MPGARSARNSDTGNEDDISFARLSNLNGTVNMLGARSTRDNDTGNKDDISFARLSNLNGTVMCRGHGVPEMVTPAMRTTSVMLVF